jgi:hypothetical protein
LWLPFGQERNRVVNELIALREKYPDFVINSKKQLMLMKGNWGGIGTMSFVGNTIFRPYGKRKEALLYRKCRQQIIKAYL